MSAGIFLRVRNSVQQKERGGREEQRKVGVGVGGDALRRDAGAEIISSRIVKVIDAISGDTR